MNKADTENRVTVSLGAKHEAGASKGGPRPLITGTADDRLTLYQAFLTVSEIGPEDKISSKIYIGHEDFHCLSVPIRQLKFMRRFVDCRRTFDINPP